MLKPLASFALFSLLIAPLGCKGGGEGASGTGGSGGNGAGGSGDAGASGAGGPGGAGADASTAVDPMLVPAFAQQARDIAGEYVAWGRVDDELRWAPFLCRIPLPGVARPSESTDPSTHGQKLYSVFVKNRDAYPEGPHEGQVVVKESWRSEAVTGPDAGYAPEKWRAEGDGGDHFYPYARGEDGGVFRASEPAGLYLMWKLQPAAEASEVSEVSEVSDDGWVYATILPSGEVTAAGRVASCMGCHETAPYDRLFGVPKAPL